MDSGLDSPPSEMCSSWGRYRLLRPCRGTSVLWRFFRGYALRVTPGYHLSIPPRCFYLRFPRSPAPAHEQRSNHQCLTFTHAASIGNLQSPIANALPHQQQHQQDDHYQAKSAARIIPPAAAMGPCRQGAEQKKDEDDKKNRVHSREQLSFTKRSSFALATRVR